MHISILCMYVGIGEIAMDTGMTEDFELRLISEILNIRDKFESIPHFQHLPFPQNYPFQCNVRT